MSDQERDEERETPLPRDEVASEKAVAPPEPKEDGPDGPSSKTAAGAPAGGDSGRAEESGRDGASPGKATAADKSATSGRAQALRHALVNSFIALFLFLILADGLPMRTTFTKRLKAGLDPFLDATGIWQDNWKLFAPNVDKINTYLEAKVFYSDGSEWSWTSTDWQSIGRMEMFFYVRLVKLWDLMRRDDHKAAWPALVDWLLTQAPDRGDAHPVRVELYRYWWDASHPKKADREWEKYSEIPPPRDEFPKEYRFYRKTIR